MPFGKPFSFKDSLSASGRIAIMPADHIGGAYFGFFNSQRQGWRAWSSLAIRLRESVEAAPAESLRLTDGNEAVIHVDYRTGQGAGNLYEPGVAIPADGSQHTWSLSYEPEVRPTLTWPDADLKRCLTEAWQPEEAVLSVYRTPNASVSL
jgi:hypothetical protein